MVHRARGLIQGGLDVSGLCVMNIRLDLPSRFGIVDDMAWAS